MDLHPKYFVTGALYIAAGLGAHAALYLNPWFALDPAIVLLIGSACVIALNVALEARSPYQPRWRGQGAEVMRELAFTLFMSPVVILGTRVAVQALVLAVFAHQTPLEAWWPSAWPLAAQVVLALGLRELGLTTAHLALHKVGFLWRFHAVHHRAGKLGWRNSGYAHPMDFLLFEGFAALLTAPLVPMPVIVWTYFVANSIAFLSHLNVNVNLGPLAWVFVSPEAHRLHHHVDVGRCNCNYGVEFPLFDIVLGYFVLPRHMNRDRDIPLGIHPRGPQSSA